MDNPYHVYAMAAGDRITKAANVARASFFLRLTLDLDNYHLTAKPFPRKSLVIFHCID